jgi:glycosyltransferase involved in cell wall biosynthesis
MREADMLMMTSLSEGVPLVLFEALAAELPFMTPTRNTAIQDFFSSEHGYFIEEATNAVEYVEVLEHVLDNPAEARAKAARNRERENELDVSRFVERVHQLLLGPQTARGG